MGKSFSREMWLGIGIILGSITIFLVGSSFISDTIAKKSNAISNARLLLATRAELISNLADIKKLTPEANAYKQKFDSLLPSQDQLLNVTQVLNGLASVHKISLSFSFRGSPTMPQPTSPGVVNFAMDVGGALNDIALFLNDAELKSTRFLIGIDSYDLSKAGEGYHLQIQGRSFFQ